MCFSFIHGRIYILVIGTDRGDFLQNDFPRIWDGLYEYPVCRLSEAQYSLADGVFKQMIWAMENGDEESRKNILQNCIYNVFLALDIVFKPMFPDLGKCYQKDQSRVLFGKFMSLLAKNFHVKEMYDIMRTGFASRPITFIR